MSYVLCYFEEIRYGEQIQMFLLELLWRADPDVLVQIKDNEQDFRWR